MKPAKETDLDLLRSCLEDYLRQKGVNTRRPFRCLSPEHEDRHPSMSFNAKAQNVHCFACGATYDLFDLIGFDYNRSTFPEQREKAAELFRAVPGVKTDSRAEKGRAVNLESGRADWKSDTAGSARWQSGEGSEKKAGRQPSNPQGTAATALEPEVLALSVVHNTARSGGEVPTDRTAELDKLRAASDGKLDYFAARGIPASLCERYGLFQSGGRAVMPVFDDAGRCLGWCARAVADGVEPRYKNSSGPLALWRAVPAAKTDSRAGKDALLNLEAGNADKKAGQVAQEMDMPGNLASSGQHPLESRASRAGKDALLNLEATGRGGANATDESASEVSNLLRNVTSGTESGLQEAERTEFAPDTTAGSGGDFSPQRGLGQSPDRGAPAAQSQAPDAAVYITEGILDALTLIAAGKRAIALCGSQNTRKLFALVDAQAPATRFIACGDGDNAGRKMNAALIEGFTARHLACSVLELPEGADINALYLQDAQALERMLAAAEAQLPDAPGEPNADYDDTSALGALDDFFAQAERRAGAPGESTGLLGLDAALGGGLRPGLIVLGAPSSLGKTSLVLQIADHIAHSGTDVLYFSLEMSRYELMAKSLSRVSAELDDRSLRRALTARDLLCGAPCADLEQELLLKRARAAYGRYAGRVFLREGLANIGPLEIRAAVAEHIARRGGKPVVFVDYLQILAPSDLRASDKQNTDRAVVELKRVSRDFDLPVVAISSFNREGYRSAAAMESFKESGAVEYSSDVLLALQLAGVGEPGFDANAQKLRDPRELELVMLKNRSGVPYAKLKLEYLARFGLFVEA